MEKDHNNLVNRWKFDGNQKPIDKKSKIIKDVILEESILEEEEEEEEDHESSLSNNYPEAGENAQPEVSAAVRRFRNLSPEERAKTPLLYWLLGSGTPSYKMDPDDAHYGEPQVEGQNCGNCEFAWKEPQTGSYICSQIADEITPKAWCRLWDKD